MNLIKNAGRLNGAGKILFFASILIFFGVAPHVFADGFTALAPIPGLTDSDSTSVVNSVTLANFFNNLYKYLIGVAAILAVIEITWHGIEIAVNKENVSKLLDSKGRIYNAIFGLALVLSPALVFSIINPSILNLSLNLPALNTSPVNIAGGGGGTTAQTPTTVDPNGCRITGTFLKTATCPTQAAAQQFVASCVNTGTISACNVQNADGTSGCAAYTATCSAVAGPYSFIDVSSVYVPSLGSPLLSSSYQPLVTSASSATNGADVMNFVAACLQDTGCVSINPSFSTIPCTYTTPQPTSQNNKCYSNKISCTAKPYFGCSPPNWTPIK